jgi:putative peptidoglycan lipid II flippase
VILIGTGLLFLAMPGPSHLSPETITVGQVAVLGIGTILGVAAQTLALLPALRRTGFRWRLRLGLGRLHLRALGRTAAWLVCYLAVSQAGVFVVLAIAKRASDVGAPGPFIYGNGWLLLMMGYGIVALPIITALMPEMSTTAAGAPTVGRDLGLGTRMIVVAVTPAATGLVALAVPISILLFEWRRYTHIQALDTAEVLVAAGFCLLPYAISQLQTFAFFALRDARTPALLNLPVTALRIGLDLLFYFTLPADRLVVALMISNGISYLVAAAAGAALLNRHLGSRYAGLGVGRLARTVLAGAIGGLFAAGVAWLLAQLDTGDKATSLMQVLAGGGVLVVAYLLSARLFGVREISQVTAFAMAWGPGRVSTRRP